MNFEWMRSSDPPSGLLFDGVVLAGGASSRMGCDKAGLVTDGRTWLRRSVSWLRDAGAVRVHVSSMSEEHAAADGPVLRDRVPGSGPLGGIERALDVCSGPLVLVLAVDMPGMTVGFLRGLVSRCGPSRGVVPRRAAGWEPLVAVYPTQAHALAVQHLREGLRSARGFAQACWQAGWVEAWDVAEPEARCLANCNTPAEFVALPERPEHPPPGWIA